MTSDEDFMGYLLELLERTAPAIEVPVAAMVVKNGKILSEAVNLRETDNSILAHAEILALEKAAKVQGDWNLSNCTLYVTLEPCSMCAGAILQSHIKKVVFSAFDFKAGALGSRFDLRTKNLEVVGGILEDRSKEILEKFFVSLRGAK